jgi:RimJ/RimL family protein N-acetyltransferase
LIRLIRYDGDPSCVSRYDAAPGWPHDDTADALRFAAGGGWTWLVLDDDRRVAGECGTKAPPDADGRVEIGYGLAPGSRGRGLGTRAVAELLDELEHSGVVREVSASVHPSNVASRRLLERLGFAIVTADDGEIGYARALTPRD